MATWQADFRLILDAAALPGDFRARLDEVLPRGRSWSSEIEQWGEADSDRIDVSVEPGELPEVFCRFDLRTWKPELYRRFVEWARAIGARLVTADGEAIELQVLAFELALRRSGAARFVADPGAYLEALGPSDEPAATTRRAWHFKQLKWALQALAIPAVAQTQLFPEWVAIADELALDFDHWESVMLANYGGELSRQQTDRLVEVDQKLRSMSRDGADFEPDLWGPSGLSSSPHWAQVRLLAASALEAFGWFVESPPSAPSERGVTYIR